jgi:CubicO group peptidase (beta-lactamase class C family)
VDVDGEVAPGCEPVRDAVAQVLDVQGGGLAVAARLHGRPAVDLGGGTVGKQGRVHTWSAVKSLMGACALMLVERGRLGLDQSVADVWPELRAAAGGHLRVRHVLAHAAGLVAVPPPGTGAGLLDWDATCRGLEAAAPAWAPGAAVGEHAFTYGHLVGELVRRVDGRPVGRFVADELAGPLGVDAHIGVAGPEEARAVDTEVWSPTRWATSRGEGGPLRAAAVPTGVDAALVNGGAWRRAEVPAVAGHATARGLAAFWAALLAGRLPAAVDRVGAEGTDLVLGSPVRWTLSGGRAEEADVGMGRLGGQWAGARPADGLAWAFLTTVLGASSGSRRWRRRCSPPCRRGSPPCRRGSPPCRPTTGTPPHRARLRRPHGPGRDDAAGRTRRRRRTDRPSCLDGSDGAGLRALRALGGVELHLLALGELPVAPPLDGRVVDEDVGAAVIRADEPVALARVEPLDRAQCHRAPPCIRARTTE